MDKFSDEVVEIDGHAIRIEQGRAGAFTGNLDLWLLAPFFVVGAAVLAGSSDPRWVTRITTALPGCPPLRFSARPGSYFASLGRQDLQVGHAGFDDRYIVKTRSREAVQLWLGPVELDALLSTYDPAALRPFAATIVDGQLELVTVASSMNRTTEAIAAAVLLAARGRRLASQWAEHAALLGGRVRGDCWTCDSDAAEPLARAGFAIEVAREAMTISIDFPYRLATMPGRRLRTRVWATHDEEGVAVGWRADLGRSSRPRLDEVDAQPWIGGLRGGARPAGWLDPRADRLAALIAAAAVDWLVVTENLAGVGWESYVSDVDRLARACEAVELLARPRAFAGGPYRGA